MIERVAKALWDEEQSKECVKWGFSNELIFGKNFVGKSVPWEFINSEKYVFSIAQEWRNKSIAAIKAMREPTAVIEKVDTWSVHYDSGELWSKFIDFILNHPEIK